jgi:hypothetical protein
LAKRGKSVVPAEPKQSAAERLFNLFAALDRVHGRYLLTGDFENRPTGRKAGGKASLVKAPPTVALWQEHLDGTAGLGLVPIRDDATCRWGAIDIDVYNLDHGAIVTAVKKLHLPLLVCRTKSGGAHLYLFCKEDVDAALIQRKLGEMSVALGYGGVEIFPKQTRLGGKQDFGSWINLPYFHADVTQRWCYGPKGGQMTVEEFLDAAEAAQLTAEQLEALQPTASTVFADGPPCLQALATQGFPAGSRNNALFNMGVYLRKKHGEGGWDKELSDFNQEYMHPAVGANEVLQITKSVRKKSYEYKCKEQPICAACNKQLCLTRPFGIRGARNDPGVTFGELTKIPTDPPIYLWDVNGERLELTSAQLMDQRKFNQVCFERLDMWPQPIRAVDWQTLVREKLEKLDMGEAPDDASRPGRLLELVEEFCQSRAHGMSRDELLMSKPWTENDKTYFRLADLVAFLEHKRVSNINEGRLWVILRKAGAGHGHWNIKGRSVKWWSVPAYQKQTAPLDTPAPADVGI